MNKLIEYIAEVEGKGVSSRGEEIFIEKRGLWDKLTPLEVSKYQEGYKAWLVEKAEEGLKVSLMALADGKQEDAERLILGYKATPKQIERYKDKYERAKAGEFDKAINAIIIQKFEATRLAIRQFTDMIEKYRRLVSGLIKSGKFDKAEKAIEAGQGFGVNTTKSDIDKLFKGL